jgi:hypothetical protein
MYRTREATIMELSTFEGSPSNQKFFVSFF